jgi:hypothetical protein
MGPELGAEDIQLRHFNFAEMVSAHSIDRSYFRLGLAQDRPGKGHQSSGMLFTYTEQSGLPQLSRLTYALEDREINLSFRSDKVFYKNTSVPSPASSEEMNNRIQTWADDHSGDGSDWIELTTPEHMKKGQLPLFMVLWAAGQKGPKTESLEFLVPQVGPPLVWIAPIRTHPRRTYDEPHTVFSPEGSHTPYVIRRMLSSATEAKKFREFISRVGKASGLFQKVDIKYFGNASDPTSPFEVDAYLDDKALSLGWLGYGVSQSLPIFVELLDRPKGSWFAIQQPEVHLHPRAQASLGDVFFEMALREHKKFVVETHSDFTIDRFRMNYRRRRPNKDKNKLPTSQVLFFERKHSCNTVTALPIGPHGELPADQPSGYREFFVKEQINILGI